VVHLEHQRGLRAPVRDPLDEVCLPQRTAQIERRGVDRLGEVEQLADRPRLRQAHAADVVRDVEVGVDDPLRRAERQRRHDHPLSEPEHDPARPLVGQPEPVEVGHDIEERNRDHPGAAPRVVLRAKHEVVARLHFLREFEVPVVRLGRHMVTALQMSPPRETGAAGEHDLVRVQ